MKIPETQYEQMKRLDQGIERDRKITDRLFISLMGAIFLVLAFAFYLLHLQLHQIQIR